MTRDRTKAQIEANELDLEMHRLAERLETFADEHCDRVRKAHLYVLAKCIRGERSTVRAYMHPADRRATEAE